MILLCNQITLRQTLSFVSGIMLQGIYVIYSKKPVPDLQKRQRNVNIFLILCDFKNQFIIYYFNGGGGKGKKLSFYTLEPVLI